MGVLLRRADSGLRALGEFPHRPSAQSRPAGGDANYPGAPTKPPVGRSVGWQIRWALRVGSKTKGRSAGQPSRRLEITVVVAEADAAKRHELREAIDMTSGLRLVGQAVDASTALDLCGQEDPDIVVMGAELPGSDPLGTCRRLAELGAAPPRPVVVTANGGSDAEIDFLIAGADGIVPGAASPARLPGAVATVASGDAAVGPELSAPLLRRFQAATATAEAQRGGWRPVHGPLSGREWEVIDELHRGAQPDEIAEKLGIARATVRSHLRNIYRKLGVSSRAAALKAAARLQTGASARLQGGKERD